ncbi:MAG: alpha/beta hydrolase-fold protein [Carboxylicivirga sp.]|jgi:predicted alpha/beta superfamily hydrolase|nr:alpha/beta hydrolase-fold protein [Carboxylicivirga sp.]
MKHFSLLSLGIFLSTCLWAQEINIGFNDSISSELLNETRHLIINLPRDYHQSNKTYPVLYRLDGNIDTFTETLGTINRLAHMDELIPDMIIVMIANTNRNRDMMPTKTSFFQEEPGADNFKSFIEKELIPYIDKRYRTNNKQVLCGQSISALFSIYYFLSSPDTFDAYISCSGGFPDCEQFFISQTDAFLNTELKQSKRLFLTHGNSDFLDPEGIIKKQLIDFSNRLKTKEQLQVQLKIYVDEGHVPFQSLYHALQFVFSN